MTFLTYLKQQSKRNTRRGQIAAVLTPRHENRPSGTHTLRRWKFYINKRRFTDEVHDTLKMLWSDYMETIKVTECASCGAEFTPKYEWHKLCASCYFTGLEDRQDRILRSVEGIACSLAEIAAAIQEHQSIVNQVKGIVNHAQENNQ